MAHLPGTAAGSSIEYVLRKLCRGNSLSDPRLAPEQALVGAARTERSGTAQRAFAAAAASVARIAPDARVEKLLGEAAAMYNDPGDRGARLLAGLLCREVARNAGDAFAKHATQVLHPKQNS